MATRAKDILEVESLEVLKDKGYYNPEEIKKCTENNIIPIIPEPKPKQFKEGNIPEPKFYENQFKYDAGKDIYTCPGGRELAYSGESIKNNKNMREYKSNSCYTCEFKSKCTSNKKGRVISRWEHEKVLEDMRERVKNNPDSVKKRNCMSEHPFGTIKRGFNQGYFLTKGLVKVGGEMGLTMLAYNIRRVINILGMTKMMEIINPG